MNNQLGNDKERLPFGKQIFKLLEDEKEVLDGLLQFADQGSHLEEERTKLARERTSLTSNLVENSAKRTDLAIERTELNKQLVKNSDVRTQLADKRTEMADVRTNLMQEQTRLSVKSTELAEHRTSLANKRTEWALIALGIALIRYFGLGLWTIMDGLLIFTGIVTMGISIRAYLSTYREERNIVLILNEKLQTIENFVP